MEKDLTKLRLRLELIDYLICGAGYIFFLVFIVAAMCKVFKGCIDCSAISTIVGTGLISIIVFYLTKKYQEERKISLQRMELKKRAMECFEEVNKLIIKIRFYSVFAKSKGDKENKFYDDLVKDIRVDFDKIANFFYELRDIYRKLPDIVYYEDINELDKKYDNKWREYFLFKGLREEDLNKLREVFKEREEVTEYLTDLKKALVEFIRSIEI